MRPRSAHRSTGPARSPWRGTRLARLLAVSWVAFLLPGVANALSIDVSFTSSTYQVQAGDTYLDLLAQHQAGALLGTASVTALANISTAIYAPGVTTDYSILMSVTLDVGVSGLYTFQAGVDWGRGGVAAVIDDSTGQVVSEYVRTDNLWWANDWNNPDVFTTQVNLAQGDTYTLAWVGFEDCCAGGSTIRFSYGGGAFQTLDTTSLAPYAAVPEPAALLLVGAGLSLLLTHRSRRA
jgi:hypothetical protein